MTAPQASPSANERTLSFAGLIAQALRPQHTVDHVDPEVRCRLGDLLDYDVILVGLAPITALGANRAYGALSLINLLRGDPRLRLFIDAPNPAQITHGLAAIANTPENLTKPFYAYRKGFKEVQRVDRQLELLDAVYGLLRDPWPPTLYPSLPWKGADFLQLLPDGASNSITGVNLDSLLLSGAAPKPRTRYENFVSDRPITKWTDSIARTITSPVYDMKRNKFSTDEEVSYSMSTSLGAIIVPQAKGGTWWTARYAQALRSGTPVITEWRDSWQLGDAWTMLASQVEELNSSGREQLAQAQLSSYVAHLHDAESSIDHLESALGLAESTKWVIV